MRTARDILDAPTWDLLDGCVINADCIEAMAAIPESSVVTVVTDPPYGIGFMGHEWDQPGVETSAAHGASCNVSFGGHPHPAMEAGRYDLSVTANRRYQAWCEVWARECFRILRPGGHLLASCGTRTYHRMAAGIEDAGFEIRDSIMWLYGSGFPKSLDVSKAIDKAAGAERAVVGRNPNARGDNRDPESGWRRPFMADPDADSKLITAPATPEAAQWDGWGTALKPAHEPIVVARKPLVGTVAQNVLEHGTGGINVAGCRLEAGTGGARDGEETAEKVYVNGIGGDQTFTMRPGPRGGSADGRWPANAVFSHLEDCKQVGTKKVKVVGATAHQKHHGKGKILNAGEGQAEHAGYRDADGTETVESWECAPGCPVAELDRQSGRLQSGRLQSGRRAAGVRKGMGFHGANGDGGPAIERDSGGASRFFYCAKTSRAERNAGLEGFEEKAAPKLDGGEFLPVQADGGPSNTTQADRRAANHHPTVKPINLMRWLVRLVTPPGGLVLDPFLGSGSTGCAAALEGFDFVGIERESEYVEIAKARIAFWSQHTGREVEDVLGLHAASSKQAKQHAELGQVTIDELLKEAA